MPEGLAVRNDKSRLFSLFPQIRKRLRQLAFPDAQSSAAVIQHIAQDLDLREDQPALRSRKINGNDQNHQIHRAEQISRQNLFRGRSFPGFRDRLLQGVNILAGQSAHPDLPDHARSLRESRKSLVLQRFLTGILSLCTVPFGCTALLSRIRGIFEIAFVPGQNAGNLPLRKQFQKFPVAGGQSRACLCHQDRRIGPVQDFLRPLDPHLSEGSFIVETRGIDDHDRSQRKQLHGL